MKQRNLDTLYHAIPLHYLPSLFAAGALYAQSVLTSHEQAARPTQNCGLEGLPSIPGGIRPRSSATRRDRMLGLDHFVHLSPAAKSPLLADKLSRGYPHALLVFEARPILDMPEVALLPYNTKAWRTRACFQPVTDPAERAAVLRRYIETDRLPSLEILVKYGLPISVLVRLAFVNSRERDMAVGLSDFDLLTVDPDLFPMPSTYEPGNWDVICKYFDRCRTSGNALPPPSMPFD